MSSSTVATAPSGGTDHARGPSGRGQWRPLLVRMHFYGGILVAPFIVMACLTGMIYAFSPQIDRLTHSRFLVTDPGDRQPLPLNQQVANAVATEPALRLVSVVPNTRPDETTRVNFARPGAPPMTNHAVFVDPYSGTVRGAKDVSMHGGGMPFTAWLAQFHADLGLGEVGRWYSELASLWLVVLTLGGLVVWWQRCAVHRRITSTTFWRRFAVLDRGRRPGVKRTMSWHSTIGVWTAVLALLFAATGLPFARTSGPKWAALSGGSLHSSSATLNTMLPGAQPAAGSAARGGAATGTAGHDHGAAAPAVPPLQGMAGSSGGSAAASTASADFDAMAGAARAAGIDQTIRLTAPTRPGTGWVVAESKPTWPVAYDSALLDPQTHRVVRTFDWDGQTPFINKLNRWIMLFHFGRLFGFAGQIIFALTMLGVLWITWWGYQMWWQRRPRGTTWRLGKAPTRGTWRRAPRLSLVLWGVLAVGTCWVFPVLGVSVAGFLVLDALRGLALRRRTELPARGRESSH